MSVKYWCNFFCAIFFYPTGPISSYKYSMRNLYQILSLSPAPLFFLGFIYSLVNPTASICGAGHYEMSVMWFVMMLAHVTPWILFWQQRDFTRN